MGLSALNRVAAIFLLIVGMVLGYLFSQVLGVISSVQGYFQAATVAPEGPVAAPALYPYEQPLGGSHYLSP